MSIDIVARAMAASAEGGEGTTYTAGDNIQISASNVISATDTTYEAGEGITIEDNVISATGGTEYTAGDGISIEGDTISIDVVVPTHNILGEQGITSMDGDSISVDDGMGDSIRIDGAEIEFNTDDFNTQYFPNRIEQRNNGDESEVQLHFESDQVVITSGRDGEWKNIVLSLSDAQEDDYIPLGSLIDDAFTEITEALEGKQDTLTAGTNITIENNVISASGGGSSYTAGNGIDITNDVISLDGDAFVFKKIERESLTAEQIYDLRWNHNTICYFIFGTDILFCYHTGKTNNNYQAIFHSIDYNESQNTYDVRYIYVKNSDWYFRTVRIPTKVSELSNDRNFITTTQLDTKQNKATASTTDIGVGTTLADGEIYLVYEE